MTRILAAAVGALLVGAAAVALAPVVTAPVAASDAGLVNVHEGVAIKGYDPVAYHRMGAPVAGDPAFQATHAGATYRFASAGNRDAFLADPEAFAPQYGGYCAYGVAQGYKADIDPAAFTIVDGRLYLNFDARVQATWSKDIPGYIGQADTNWPAVQHETRVFR